jgi:hypothetical protein
MTEFLQIRHNIAYNIGSNDELQPMIELIVLLADKRYKLDYSPGQNPMLSTDYHVTEARGFASANRIREIIEELTTILETAEKAIQ